MLLIFLLASVLVLSSSVIVIRLASLLVSVLLWTNNLRGGRDQTSRAEARWLS